MTELHLLGPLRVTGSAAVSPSALLARPKRLALLTWLIGAGPAGVRQRDEILAVFWPDADEEHARTALRQALQVLRRVLGAAAIPNRGTGVLVDPAHCWSDLQAITDALNAGDHATANALYRGELLQGLVVPGAGPFMEWLDSTRRRLHERVAESAERLSKDAEANGDAAGALHWARRAAQLLPLESRATSRLVELFERAGEEHAALGALERFTEQLRRELDVAPGDDVQLATAELRRRQHAPEFTVPHGPHVTPNVAMARPRIRVCVTPVLALTHEGDLDLEAEGLTEELIAALAELDGLEVLARASSAALRSDPTGASTLGRRVDADFVVAGTVRTGAYESRRVVLRVHDVAGDSTAWARRYSFADDGVLAMYDRVTFDVAAALRILVPADGRWMTARRRSRNVEAHQHWLRGMHHVWRRTPQDLQRSLEHLERATTIDPSFASAWEGLADVWITLPIYAGYPARDALPRAIMAADRALALDASLPLAHAYRGLLATTWEWDLDAAAAHLQEAVRVGPCEAAVHIIASLYVHCARGDREATLSASRRALALDPVNALSLAYAALGASIVGAYDEARAFAEQSLQLDPALTVAHWAMSRVYSLTERHADALEHADTLVELTHGGPMFTAFRAGVLARGGQLAQAEAVLGHLAASPSLAGAIGVHAAAAWLALGDESKAIACLEEAASARSSGAAFVRSEPFFESLRTDARFQAITHQLKG